MTLVERLIKNASFSVIGGLTISAGGFVSAAIVARSLGVHGTAAVAMALLIVFFATTIADVGVSGSLARFMTREAQLGGREGLRTFVWDRFKLLLAAIAGGLLLVGVFLAFYWLDIVEKYAVDRQEALLICALIIVSFIVHMLVAFSFQYLRGSLQFQAISRYSVMGAVLQVAGVFAGSQQFGVVGALAGYLLGSLPILWVLSYLRVADAVLPAPEQVATRRYALSFYVAALLSPLLWVRADLLIVDQIASAEAVGLFAAAATVAALLIQLCQMVCNALLPNILQAAAEQPEASSRASTITTRFGMFLLLPACFVGAALAPNAIELVYGAEFAGAGPTATLLGCAAAASAITLVLSGVLNAADANASLVRSGIVGAALTVVLGLTFVSHFGLIGAAIGRLGAQSTVAAMNIVAANRVVPGVVQPGWFIRYLVTSVVAGCAACLAAHGRGLLGLLLGGAAGALTFLVITVLALRLVTDDRSALLRSIAGQPAWVRRAAALLIGRPV
ncbi:oligosaccharide flippase family protein [uncultured Sphingomonas sp.]|uniref:oligosaccharide flippase family protein n=1 Tax=uncultured Sphingomonas sp. TaxID=158754 RepID=UPI0025E2EE2A|nr:oligosaccharide flippase family protein [uncultured Sphingomonas sp.]